MQELYCTVKIAKRPSVSDSLSQVEKVKCCQCKKEVNIDRKAVYSTLVTDPDKWETTRFSHKVTLLGENLTISYL